MGLFDVSIKKDLKITKEELISYLKKSFSSSSDEVIEEKNYLLFKYFKAKGAFLNYDLKIEINTSKNTISLDVFGELLNVWIMVIIIIAGILFTYGIGVILLVAFVYYQKIVVNKFINNTLNKLDN